MLVLSCAGVGKTCLVSRYTSGTFVKSAVPTIGAAFLTKKLSVTSPCCCVCVCCWVAPHDRMLLTHTRPERSMELLGAKSGCVCIIIIIVGSVDSCVHACVCMCLCPNNMCVCCAPVCESPACWTNIESICRSGTQQAKRGFVLPLHAPCTLLAPHAPMLPEYVSLLWAVLSIPVILMLVCIHAPGDD